MGNQTPTDGIFSPIITNTSDEWAAFDSFPKSVRQALSEAPLEYSPTDLKRAFDEGFNPFFAIDRSQALLEIIEVQSEGDSFKYREYMRRLEISLPGSAESIAERYIPR